VVQTVYPGVYLPYPEAIRLRAPRYYTARPCAGGHVAWRITSTQTCEQCRTKYRSAYKADPAKRHLIRAHHDRRASRRWEDNPSFVCKRRIARATYSQLKRVALGTTSKRVGIYTNASAQTLRDYLSKQFQLGFSWENYGSVWVADHIRPFAAFDLDDPAQLALCASWFNLQPLAPWQNSEKSDRWTPDEERKWAQWVRSHGYSGNLYLMHSAEAA